MKISQDVRRYAAEHGVDETAALELGMKEKSAEFTERGGTVYLPLLDQTPTGGH